MTSPTRRHFFAEISDSLTSGKNQSVLILNIPYVIYYLKSINQITKYVLVVIVYIIDNITLESFFIVPFTLVWLF